MSVADIDPEILQIYLDFWRPLVAPQGVVDMTQVLKELYDYRTLMKSASLVYDAVTCGRISKVNTIPSAVIAEFEDYVDRQITWALEDQQEGKEMINDRCDPA